MDLDYENEYLYSINGYVTSIAVEYGSPSIQKANRKEETHDWRLDKTKTPGIISCSFTRNLTPFHTGAHSLPNHNIIFTRQYNRRFKDSASKNNPTSVRVSLPGRFRIIPKCDTFIQARIMHVYVPRYVRITLALLFHRMHDRTSVKGRCVEHAFMLFRNSIVHGRAR